MTHEDAQQLIAAIHSVKTALGFAAMIIIVPLTLGLHRISLAIERSNAKGAK